MLLLALLFGCQQAAGPLVGATPGVREASCATQEDNALRVECTVVLDQPAPVAIAFGEGATDRLVHSDDVALEHHLVLHGLHAETAVDWSLVVGGEATARGGRVVTDALPEGVASVGLEISGASALDHLLFFSRCEPGVWLVIADTGGRIVWYEKAGGAVTALTFTPDGTVLYVQNMAKVREVALDGAVLLDVGGFDRPLHHDLSRDAAGRTWVLNADLVPGTTDVMDGLYVLDSEGVLLTTWDLADHVPDDVAPPQPADDFGYWDDRFGDDAMDWSHANSVQVTDELFVVSFRLLDTVVAFDAVLDDPGFGEVLWAVTGRESSRWPTPLIGGFESQHHATLQPDGTLTLFDNGDPVEESEGLHLAFDPLGDEVEVLGSYPAGDHCTIQGSVFPAGDDGLLVTCPGTKTALEYGALDDAPRFEATVTCASEGVPGPVPRVIPVAL